MKPRFVLHRQNKTEDICQLPDLSWGAEVDLRSTGKNGEKKILLAHDPWTAGEDFETWVQIFRARKITGPLILNTKEDGLEERSLEILRRYEVENFFFLDTTWPSLVHWSLKKKVPDFAVRLSAFESLAQVPAELLLAVKYVWIDCFSVKPLGNLDDLLPYPHLKKCLVSPELQGGSAADFPVFLSLAKQVDFICTKNPAAWQESLRG